MIEFINRNLENTEPDYFYRVTEFVTTFNADAGKNDSFTHQEDFRETNLKDCREKAIKYYEERLSGMDKTKFFLPFANPSDFKWGENAAFSMSLALVEWYSEADYHEHIIAGEDDETNKDGLEIERVVLQNLDN